MPRKILYMQHAGALGGSCMSLLYTLQGLDRRRVHPVIALIRPTRAVAKLYNDAGFETIDWPGIPTFEHTTLQWARLESPRSLPEFARTLVGWQAGERRTRELIAHVRPDLVHLNSAVLSCSAHTLRSMGMPFVWHVREAPPPAGAGRHRTAWLGTALRQWPDATVFLSAAERRAWHCDGDTCHVVHNFVDLKRFVPSDDQAGARATRGIDADAPVLLYLGGMARVKGIEPLVQALPRVVRAIPNLVCLMPGAIGSGPPSWRLRLARRLLPLVGRGTVAQRAYARLGEPDLAEHCRLSQFESDVRQALAASDVLVFPAVRDHFARPVIEAFAMGKPVVASSFPITQELMGETETGLLVPPSDAHALSDALIALLGDRSRARAMGGRAHHMARERFSQAHAARAITAIYERVLGGELR